MRRSAQLCSKYLVEPDRTGPILRKAARSGKAVDQLKSARVPVPFFRGDALYGSSVVLEALTADRREIHKLYMKQSVREKKETSPRISEILSLAEENRVPIHRLTQTQLDRITNCQSHNGICLDAGPLPVCLPRDVILSVYLDDVLDPGNIGAIGRTAHFFGAKQLVYARNRGPPTVTPLMSKTSCGAMEHLPIAIVDDFSEFKKSTSSLTVGTLDEASAARLNKKVIPVHEWSPEPHQKLTVVLGSEDGGISSRTISLCDVLISIPGGSSSVTSLNVSVVAGIILHHIQGI